jgi:hypothetical protein
VRALIAELLEFVSEAADIFGSQTSSTASARAILKDGTSADRSSRSSRRTGLRAVRDEGLEDPWLKDRVSRESARPEACDFSYLLNVMHDRALQLRPGSDPCAVYAYDQTDRQEICLFDTEVEQAVWLSASWACMTRTGVMGKGESCHKLCSFDDYCSKQVSCAQADIDLALCALGVCLPEPDVMSE